MRAGTPLGIAAAVLIAWLAVALLTPGLATAQIYWANETGDKISRANLNGLAIVPNFVTGATAPRAVAIDASLIYWAHDAGVNGSIGRADRADGGSPNQTFIATAGAPEGLAVDNARIFWTQSFGGGDKVARANLNGTAVNQAVVSTGPLPCGVASDTDDIYWANGGDPGSIGSAHGGPPENQNLITATAEPCGLARAGPYVYWTNRGGDSIGRANQDGSDPNQDFITLSPGSSPCGLAVNGDHIYWTTSNAIGRAGRDGSDPQEDFITDASAVQGACGIAVSPTQEATPSMHAFPGTGVGTDSDIQAFLVANTSSSALDVTEAVLLGPNAGDFEKTGDSCTINVTPAGVGCLLNVRFRPGSEGIRSATLRVTSDASNSPTDIALTGLGTPSPPTAAVPAAEDPRCANLRRKLNRRRQLNARKGKKEGATRRIHRRIRSLGC